MATSRSNEFHLIRLKFREVQTIFVYRKWLRISLILLFRFSQRYCLVTYAVSGRDGTPRIAATYCC